MPYINKFEESPIETQRKLIEHLSNAEKDKLSPGTVYLSPYDANKLKRELDSGRNKEDIKSMFQEKLKVWR